MDIDLDSEPYSTYGNISADGVRKLLGAPPLDRLTTMIRETVQNSWDARIRRPATVPEYLIRIRELGKSQAHFLRDNFFAQLPPDGQEDRMREALENSLIVEIADFGTVGLDGPTQPGEAVEEEESTNFVDFLRNVGTPRNEQLGGGTYGFGKSSLFMLSGISTIIVDSETNFRGRSVRRLMGCRIGSNYSAKRTRFTGRHWWGSRHNNGLLEPLTGRDAKTIRSRLGLPERDPEQTGTTLAIIAPQLPVELDNAGDLIVRTLMVNFWPKLVAGTNGRYAMKFRIEVRGKNVPIPSPANTPPFNLFARALKAARTPDASNGIAKAIHCERPRRLLGHLAIEPGSVRPRTSAFEMADAENRDRAESDPVETPCRHVALMRPAELVVKYLPGPAMTDTTQEWAGVFIASAEHDVESAFAESEPPAHDDWNPDSIAEKSRRTLVKVALRRIRDEVTTRFRPAAPETSAGGQDFPLGAAADRFGQALLAGGSGTGVSRVTPAHAAAGGRAGKGGISGTRLPGLGEKLWIGPPSFSRLEVVSGIPASVFSVRLESPPGFSRKIVATPKLVMDGQPVDTSDIPLGVAAPKILAWKTPDGMRKGAQLAIGEGLMELEVFVSCDGEHVTSLTVEEVPGASQ